MHCIIKTNQQMVWDDDLHYMYRVATTKFEVIITKKRDYSYLCFLIYHT